MRLRRQSKPARPNTQILVPRELHIKVITSQGKLQKVQHQVAADPAQSIDHILGLEAHLEVGLTAHHLTTVMTQDILDDTDVLAQDHILDLVADLGHAPIVDGDLQVTLIIVDLAHTLPADHEVAHIEEERDLTQEAGRVLIVAVHTAVIQEVEIGTESHGGRTVERGVQMQDLCLLALWTKQPQRKLKWLLLKKQKILLRKKK